MGDYRTAQQGPTSGSPTIRVLVTGFGPFGEHSVNASWEAVRHLTVLDDLKDVVDLFVEEIPVKYHEVSTVVPDLWKKYQPHLVIHCGVSGLLAWKNTIQIERQASCHGYHRPDVDACVPLRGYCVANDGENCITTGVNLDGLHTWFEGAATDRSPEQSQHGATLQCQMSEDAGRFLCEFIYYTSLRINEKATLFIHVPPLDKPFGAAEIADAIKTVILRVCEQNNFTATTEEAAAKNFHITGVPHLDVSPKPAQTTNDESFHIADVQHMMLDEMQNALQ